MPQRANNLIDISIVARLGEVSPAAGRIYLAQLLEVGVLGIVDLSDQQLADLTGISRSRVAEAIRELERASWIEVLGRSRRDHRIRPLVGDRLPSVENSTHTAPASVEISTHSEPQSVENSTHGSTGTGSILQFPRSVENSTVSDKPKCRDLDTSVNELQAERKKTGTGDDPTVEISTPGEKNPPLIPPLFPPAPPNSPPYNPPSGMFEKGMQGEKLLGKKPGPEPGADLKTSPDLKPKAAAGDPRGSRLPDPFLLTAAMRSWAEMDKLSPIVDLTLETKKFCDYYRSAPGVKGRKTDWTAAWRNWIRKAFEDLPAYKRNGGYAQNGKTKSNFAGSKDANFDATLNDIANDPAFGFADPGR